jgi:hypothetical protein
MFTSSLLNRLDFADFVSGFPQPTGAVAQVLCRSNHERSDRKSIVHQVSEVLFAAQVRSSAPTRGPARTESAQARRHPSGTVFAHVRRSWGAICSSPTPLQQSLTTYHTTFCEIPLPHTLPRLLTARKILPSVIPAAVIHRSSARFAHCGIGTVRTGRPLPIKSTMAQCPWRVWTSRISSPTNSDRRRPQPSNMANMA